ncbi:MAG TPA: alpha/beta hydrolase, partial [Blastocatellia bacterium]|nr:alpha/beta hydrolase [Blastocatellia bacterium]
MLKKLGFMLTAVLTLALGIGANRAAFFVTAPAQQMLDGDWTGEIKIGKETISINMHFKRGPDGDTGSVEMMGQKDLALASIRLQSNRLQFELPRELGSFSFNGLLQVDAITGEVRRGTERGSFDLVKIAKIANQTLEQYVGTYELSPNHLISISLSPSFGMTFLDYQTGELRNLATSSETACSFGPAIFSRVPIEARITFTKDERGAVSGLVLQRAGSASMSARRLQFKREEVMFKNGEITLAGTLVLPNTKAPHPVFVRTHGSGRALRNIAQGEWLAYYGVAVLTYDKRGSGKSTGDVQQANISDLAGDALVGTQFLKARKDIDPQRIGLMGGSEGGWVVPLAASRSKDIAFIFVGSPSALSLAETIVYEVGTVGRERGFSEEEIKQMKALRGLYNDALLTNTGWDLVRQAISESKEKRWFRYARVPQTLPEPFPQAQ